MRSDLRYLTADEKAESVRTIARQRGISVEECTRQLADEPWARDFLGGVSSDLSDDSAWPELIPFDRVDLPSFPVEALPPTVRDYVRAVAASLQVPIDLPALAVLVVACAATGGAHEVEIGPGWVEPVVLWAAPILPSGEGKTPALGAVMHPLLDVERELREEARERVAEERTARRQLEGRLKSAEAEAVKAKAEADRMDAEERARKLAVQLANTPEPVMPRLVLQDTTAEGLTAALGDHGGRIAVVSDEAGVLDTLAGRYARGVPNLDAVLKGYDGGSVVVTRRGADEIAIQRATVPILVTPQPALLEALENGAVLRGRGLLARFALVRPVSLVGHRSPSAPPIPEDLAAAWAGLIREIAMHESSDESDETPRAGCSVGSVGRFRASGSARAVLDAVHDEVEPRLQPQSGDLADVADWASKHRGRVARIGAVLQMLAAGPEPAEIGEEVMRDAAIIGRYLLAHAAVLLPGALQPAHPDEARARAILRWVARNDHRTMSARDVQRDGVGGRHTIEDTDYALALLVKRGYLRPLPAPPPAPGRNPSPEFEVNPAVLGGVS